MSLRAAKGQESVGDLGERALIDRIRSWLGDASPASPEGIGDDCAAIALPRSSGRLLVTTDPVVLGKHFDESLAPARVAAKLARRNVSDIAAMGGAPFAATLSLALSPDVSIHWIQEFYQETAVEAKRWGYALSGGDISSTDKFFGAFMTMLGTSTGALLERQKASVGSPLFVTGDLGGSLLETHHSFLPRIEEGQWLAQQKSVVACMDLSDGLGKDCGSFLLPGQVAELDGRRIPVSPDAVKTSESSGRSALYHAINDGEDHELIFALDPSTSQERFQQAWQRRFQTELTWIGIVARRTQDDRPLRLLNSSEEIEAIGYEHFR